MGGEASKGPSPKSLPVSARRRGQATLRPQIDLGWPRGQRRSGYQSGTRRCQYRGADRPNPSLARLIGRSGQGTDRSSRWLRFRGTSETSRSSATSRTRSYDPKTAGSTSCSTVDATALSSVTSGGGGCSEHVGGFVRYATYGGGYRGSRGTSGPTGHVGSATYSW